MATILNKTCKMTHAGEKLKLSDLAGGNSQWDSRTELPFDSAIPLLGINPKELKDGIQMNTCMQIFKVSLFKTAQISVH